MNLRLSTISITLMMAFCFVAFLVNVIFFQQNNKLNSDVSSCIDEKTDLRAKYLSGISAKNLTDRADNFKMKLASGPQIYTVEGDGVRERGENFIEKFFSDLDTDMKSIEVVVSGY